MNVKTKFQCRACNEIHDSHFNATYCCHPRRVYFCQCGKLHEGIISAENCCTKKTETKTLNLVGGAEM